MEIWDALTLKLLSTLKSTRVGTKFRAGLSYSPNGQFLAGCCDIGIVIWDTQTGGEIKCIECGVTGNGQELLWSLNGETLCSFLPQKLDPLSVHVYDVTSGTVIYHCTLQSKDRPYIWAHDKYFQIATTSTWDSGRCRINISEVGDVAPEVESFTLPFESGLGTFSPTTYRISVSISNPDPELHILDIRNSEVLLQEKGYYLHGTFSPCGTFFAASTREYLSTWEYSSHHYTGWRRFQQNSAPLQFSPTSLSMLSCAGSLLRVVHLDSSPAVTKEPTIRPHGQLLDSFLPNGAFIVTTYHRESTITITNLHSQNPSPLQFIDTGLEISSIVLTGQVLLVKGSDKVVAWLLIEKGVVDGIVGNTRADCNDSLWEIPFRAIADRWSRRLGHRHGSGSSDEQLEFSIKDEIASIKLNDSTIQVYHTKTGEIIESARAPLHHNTTWYNFQGQCDLYLNDLCKYQTPPGCNWLAQTTLQGGWVKDPEGKHRLWLYGHWRAAKNYINWLHDATTLRLKGSSELVIVKF